MDHRGLVARSAPVFRVFIGQHSNRLVRWMDRIGKTSISAVEPNERQLELELV